MAAVLKSIWARVMACLITVLTADTNVQAAGEMAGMDWSIM